MCARPVIAGNWKMYKTQAETRAFFAAFNAAGGGVTHCEIIIAPPFTALAAAVEAARGSAIAIAAQNMYWATEGAFTGEVSPPMLVETGCRAVIIAHSERRQFFGETNETANRKVKAALAPGSMPILCVGETLAEREAGRPRGAGAAISRLAGRVDPHGVLAYHRCLRAGVGHRHRTHGNA